MLESRRRFAPGPAFSPLQVRVSAVLTNAPYILNLDCDHYINNAKALREAMCFHMDPNVGPKVCYIQFPQKFDGIDPNDRYANHNTVFFNVSSSRPSPPSPASPPPPPPCCHHPPSPLACCFHVPVAEPCACSLSLPVLSPQLHSHQVDR